MAKLGFKAILASEINIAVYVKEFSKELEKEGLIHRQLLGKTVSTWKNKPVFKTTLKPSISALHMLTAPTGSEKAIRQWVWVNYGTKPHTIKAKNAPNLVFRTGYVAASTPGKFKSDRHFRFGPRRRTKKVRHPGIDARDWTGIIYERRQSKFERRMATAMHRAAMQTF